MAHESLVQLFHRQTGIGYLDCDMLLTVEQSSEMRPISFVFVSALGLYRMIGLALSIGRTAPFLPNFFYDYLTVSKVFGSLNSCKVTDSE